jgi:hypothetical protein
MMMLRRSEEGAMTHSFDELAKALAGEISRRETLRRLGGVLVGALLVSLGLKPAWGQEDCDEAALRACLEEVEDCFERVKECRDRVEQWFTQQRDRCLRIPNDRGRFQCLAAAAVAAERLEMACDNQEENCERQEARCHDQFGCPSGQECVNGACRDCLEQGESCVNGLPCCPGLECEEGRCEACAEEGETCGAADSGIRCCRPLDCVDGVCRFPDFGCRELGESCNPDLGIRCCEPLSCVFGSCSSFNCLEKGELCGNSIPCCPPLQCTPTSLPTGGTALVCVEVN